MKRERLQTEVLKLTKWLIIAILLYILIQFIPMLAPLWRVIGMLLVPIAIAGLMAYLLHPLVERLVRAGMSRTLAVLLIFLSLLALLALALVIGIPLLMEQVKEAMEVLPAQLEEMKGMLVDLQKSARSLPDPLAVHMNEWGIQAEKLAEQALDQVEAAIVRFAQAAFIWVVIPFLVFYLLKDYTLLQRVAYYLTPRKWRKGLRRYIQDVDKTFGSYIRGQLLVALCVGTISTIALWLLGVPYPVVLGLFIGATDLIPYFGAFIGAVPAVTTALLDSPSLAVYTVIAIFVIQQIEGNLLSPVIVGRTLHLHPIVIILALLVGVDVAGVLGLLVAVPFVAVAKVTLLHLRTYLRKH
ncbi:AI-2E family transporter [Shouchella shacheensis]|uniref:AI-2E family transporter n=1 Tax=Shouchella shacheensis TaxID=1649580 RepID=UPI00073FCC67|nr:AI-2E family transporter [Shouchella shacheensis]